MRLEPFKCIQRPENCFKCFSRTLNLIFQDFCIFMILNARNSVSEKLFEIMI